MTRLSVFSVPDRGHTAAVTAWATEGLGSRERENAWEADNLEGITFYSCEILQTLPTVNRAWMVLSFTGAR